MLVEAGKVYRTASNDRVMIFQNKKGYFYNPDLANDGWVYFSQVGKAYSNVNDPYRRKEHDLIEEVESNEIPAYDGPKCTEGSFKKETGSKFDDGKPRLDLISKTWLFGVGDVLAFGAKKYEAENWRKGIEQKRLIGAALRHLMQYLNGENLDPESGLNHLDHASCAIMFARELLETKPDFDDRYTNGK